GQTLHVDFTPADPANYNPASKDVVINVIKAPATITIVGLTPSPTYDGTPKSVTATTSPAGLSTVTITYNGSTTPPVNAGTYTVVASLNNPSYQGSASGTLVINKAIATITFTGGLTFTYDGSPKPTTAAVDPVVTGLKIDYTDVSHNRSTDAPTNAGEYQVDATLANTNYAADKVTVTLVINKAPASIALGNLIQTYHGSP